MERRSVTLGCRRNGTFLPRKKTVPVTSNASDLEETDPNEHNDFDGDAASLSDADSSSSWTPTWKSHKNSRLSKSGFLSKSLATNAMDRRKRKHAESTIETLLLTAADGRKNDDDDGKKVDIIIEEDNSTRDFIQGSGDDCDSDDVSISGKNAVPTSPKKRGKYNSTASNLYSDSISLAQAQTSTQNQQEKPKGRPGIKTLKPVIKNPPLSGADLKFDARLDITSPLCPFVDDADWLVEQLKAGSAEYLSLSQAHRRQKILAYFTREPTAVDTATRSAETIKFFVKQRGWTKHTVRRSVDAFIKHKRTDRKKLVITRPSVNVEKATKLVDAYREMLVMSKPDEGNADYYKQINPYNFASKNNVRPSTFVEVVKKTCPDIVAELERAKNASDLHFEVKRSLIIAKYIETPGDYRERRNACVRHFWRQPGFSQSQVISACDLFLRRGSVRTAKKNAETDWYAENLQCNKHTLADLLPEERDFMQELNRMQIAVNTSDITVNRRPELVKHSDASSELEAKLVAEQTRSAELQRQVEALLRENQALRLGRTNNQQRGDDMNSVIFRS